MHMVTKPSFDFDFDFGHPCGHSCRLNYCRIKEHVWFSVVQNLILHVCVVCLLVYIVNVVMSDFWLLLVRISG